MRAWSMRCCSRSLDRPSRSAPRPSSSPDSRRPPVRACAASPEARPSTPLSDAALLTNAGEPGLGAESSRDRHLRRGRPAVRLRQVARTPRSSSPSSTTARRGARCASSPRRTWVPPSGALDRLVRDFGAEVKIQYDDARTRLHAKAWMFRREPASTPPTSARRTCPVPPCWTAWSGTFGCRGSRPALLDKFARHVRHLLERPRFESYDPDRDRTGWTMPSPRRRDAGTHDRVTHLAVRPGGAAISLPAGDARRRSKPSARARPTPQPGRGRHRHRQDGDRGARLPAAVRRPTGERPIAALRRPPPGDPRAVAAYLSRGACRRHLRRAVRRWCSARAMATRLRQRAVAAVLRRRRTSRRTPSTSW